MEDFCEGDFADVCVNGYPDFVKVCDTEFPPGMFDGSNYYQVCDLDIEDVCKSYPEICDEEAGSITSDLCGANPDWCDTSSDSYNHCAANLYDCMMDPDFDMCREFPDLCGYEDIDAGSIPMPELRARPGLYKGEYDTTFYCTAEAHMKWADVEALIDSLNYFYGYGITAGASWDFPVSQGVFRYATEESLPEKIGEGDASL